MKVHVDSSKGTRIFPPPPKRCMKCKEFLKSDPTALMNLAPVFGRCKLFQRAAMEKTASGRA